MALPMNKRLRGVMGHPVNILGHNGTSYRNRWLDALVSRIKTVLNNNHMVPWVLKLIDTFIMLLVPLMKNVVHGHLSDIILCHLQ